MTLKVTRAEFLGIDRMDEDELRDNVLDLLAENAKLRQQLADVTVSMGRVEERCAKLRELVTGLYKCWVNEGCEGCPMQDDDGWCVRDIRLRDLRVEVTE